ncbi:MAG: hypothetical protein HY904_17205 [Deltaproteobacteria bacterium]|nr:hypothetical protein [Deltaproteobacteria bacterium]
MSHLLLTDDEIALLRWTCELFFVPESPVAFVDAEQREPRDFAASYRELVGKGILDDARFRLTDIALNRLAPLTECDARVTMTLPGDRGGRARTRDYYLLDEISVEYEEVEGSHTVGPDQDHQEMVGSLIRRFTPRRSSGDFVHFKVTPAEFLTLAVLCHRARQGTTAVPPDVVLSELRPALAEGRADTLAPPRKRPREQVEHAPMRHKAAGVLAAAAADPSPARDVTARALDPVNQEATQVMRGKPPGVARMNAAQAMEEADTLVGVRAGRNRARSRTVDGPEPADEALAGLLQKGLVTQGEKGVELRPAVRTLALGLSEKNRHSFVRFDFSDDEWLVRETSFLAADGTLYGVGAEPDGLIHLMELDGRRLESWLTRAVGPLPGADEGAAGKSAKDFLLRA